MSLSKRGPRSKSSGLFTPGRGRFEPLATQAAPFGWAAGQQAPPLALTLVGGRAGLGRAGRLVFAAKLPESIEKKDGREAELNQDLEQAVDRGHRATDDDPGNASKRNQPKHDGDQEHHGKQVASYFAYFWYQAISRTVSLHPLRFKRLVDRLIVFGCERDFLVFFAKLFVDES